MCIRFNRIVLIIFISLFLTGCLANTSSKSNNTFKPYHIKKAHSSLPTCKGSPRTWEEAEVLSTWSNCTGIYIFKSRGYYIKAVQYVDFKFKSVLNNSKEGKYIGNWFNNYMDGKGTYYFGNGDRYVGNFKYGQFHGKGTLIFANGDVYDSIWEYGFIGWSKSLKEADRIKRQKAKEERMRKHRERVEQEKIAEENRKKELIKQKEQAELEAHKRKYANAKAECEEIGFKKGTEKFGECVLDLTK